MKKFLVMLMSLAMVFAFAACGSNDSGAAEEQAEPEAEIEEAFQVAGHTFKMVSSVSDDEDAMPTDYDEMLVFGDDGSSCTVQDVQNGEVIYELSCTYEQEDTAVNITWGGGTMNMTLEDETLLYDDDVTTADEYDGQEIERTFHLTNTYELAD